MKTGKVDNLHLSWGIKLTTHTLFKGLLCRLDTGWMTKGSEFESRWGQEFPLLRVVQTGSGPTQPPIQWVPGAFSPAVKRPGREADHSLATSAEVKKTLVYTSTPPYIFMA
jgi:hypothetical protein